MQLFISDIVFQKTTIIHLYAYRSDPNQGKFFKQKIMMYMKCRKSAQLLSVNIAILSVFCNDLYSLVICSNGDNNLIWLYSPNSVWPGISNSSSYYVMDNTYGPRL